MLPFTIIIIVCVTFIFRNAFDERAPPRQNGPGVRVRNKKGPLRHKFVSIGICENEKKMRNSDYCTCESSCCQLRIICVCDNNNIQLYYYIMYMWFQNRACADLNALPSRYFRTRYRDDDFELQRYNIILYRYRYIQRDSKGLFMTSPLIKNVFVFVFISKCSCPVFSVLINSLGIFFFFVNRLQQRI